MTGTAQTLSNIFKQTFPEAEAERIVRLLGNFVKEKVREDVQEVAKAAESHIDKRIERSLSSEIRHVATKEDVANVKIDLKEEVAGLRVEMKDQKAEIIKWMIAILIAQTALLITILK